MRTRLGFVSNSSSASFVVGIPSKDRSSVLKTLYYQMEHIYFGKYYLIESVKKRLSFAEEKINIAKGECAALEAIPKEERLIGKDNDCDKLDWEKSTLDQWVRQFNIHSKNLEDLKKITEDCEEELVEFGLNLHGISLVPTYKRNIKEKSTDTKIKEIQMSIWDKDATDDRDITYDSSPEEETELEILGYELRDSVTMFNEFGDLPEVLRNITGVLSFVYKELNCWVDEDRYEF